MQLVQTYAAAMSNESLTERFHGLRDQFEELSLPEIELDRLRVRDSIRLAGMAARASANDELRKLFENVTQEGL